MLYITAIFWRDQCRCVWRQQSKWLKTRRLIQLKNTKQDNNLKIWPNHSMRKMESVYSTDYFYDASEDILFFLVALVTNITSS